MYRMVPDLDVQRQIADQFDAEMIALVLRASGEVVGGRNARSEDRNKFDFVDLAGEADFDTEFNHRRAWVQFNQAKKFNIGHFENPIWKDIHDTGHAVAEELANGGALKYDGSFFLDNLRVQQGVGTTFHDSGTLWMGDDPNSSVTDVNGHFHHVTNAYCCDQALFTTIGSANPVLTGLCLSRKVADDIVDRHESYVAGAGELSGLIDQSLLPSQGWLQKPYTGMITDIGGGIIETDPQQGIGLYYLPQTFTNFELAVEWKSFRTYKSNYTIANSGILLRTPDPSQVDFSNQAAFDQFYNNVTEVQIDDTGKNFEAQRFPKAIFGDSRFKTGAVYGVASATQWAAKMLAPDDPNVDRYWNLFHIVADGNHIAVRLNGRLVCQATLPAQKPSSGFVGFQFHTGRVQFRNLKLKTLPG
jgi:hypothetical protein